MLPSLLRGKSRSGSNRRDFFCFLIRIRSPIQNLKSPIPHLKYILLAWCLWMASGGPALAQSTDLRRPAADHYDVVALRVAFQPDTTRFTSGDGTFDGELYGDGLLPSVDPLPHDGAYFQAHLDFLEHYLARVSDGQTRLTTHLVPEVVRLSQEMGAYSPTGFDADSDAERAKLVALIEEAWATASQGSTFDLSGFDPERTAFVIFHAGIGRDIELLGTVLDKTPQDLPSLFFNERELGRLASGPVAFNGFPVRHTLLIPRTETRAGFDFISDAPFLLELSINGLLAASFFNFLGAPDLFNTTDGQPAIGPFGLMDPLGFFAYNGLFPPEPSAWTKYFLGWTTPLDLAGDGPETVHLPAAGIDGTSVVARARISSAEYFLVENRYRDSDGDGLVLQVWKDGEIVEQRVQNGDATFTRLSGIEGFVGGVVVAVDDYDWALPGGLDEDDNVLNGGILIWHVDERRLAEGLESGGVNADPERRAIDLEEADSAQDIGFPSPGLFGSAADQGTPFDFFFADNPIVTITATNQEIRFYENRFGPETIPNSNSNEGGASFIIFEDFSEPASEMTFVFRREGTASITPIVSVESLTSGSTASDDASFLTRFSEGGANWLAFTGNASDTKEVAFFNEDAGEDPFRVAFDAGAVHSVVTQDGRLAVASIPSQGPTGFIDIAFFDKGSVGEPIPYAISEGNVANLTPPLIALTERDGPAAFYLGASITHPPGEVVVKMVEEAAADVFDLDGQAVRSLASDGRDVVLVGEREARVLGGAERWTYDLSSEAVGQAVFGRDSSGLVGVLPLLDSGALLILQADQRVERLDVGRYDGFIGEMDARLSAYPVLVDLDDDGRLDILTTYGRKLMAFSQAGALVRGFPIALSALSVAQPLVAELSDSGAWSIIVASTDGYVYAYDLGDGGRLVPDFPLAVGASIRTTPLLQDKKLYAVSEEGALQGWELANLGTIWWGQLYGNAQHHNFVALPVDEPDAQPLASAVGLIVEAETYNWPNPIREGQTFLRCMTTEDAAVRITIIDAAGSLIDEMTLEVQGGTPAEHLWQTNAASGLYFARVTATGTNGQTATKLIKMAIIR